MGALGRLGTGLDLALKPQPHSTAHLAPLTFFPPAPGPRPLQAQAELDGSIFMGRLLHILPGKRPPPPPEAAAGEEEGEGQKKGSYKASCARCWQSLWCRAGQRCSGRASGLLPI